MPNINFQTFWFQLLEDRFWNHFCSQCNGVNSEKKKCNFREIHCLRQGVKYLFSGQKSSNSNLFLDINIAASQNCTFFFRVHPIAYIHIDGVKKAIMKNQGQHLTSNYTHMNFLLPKFSSWTIQSKVKTIFERDKIPLLIAMCVVHT